jgi:hypothetical protein
MVEWYWQEKTKELGEKTYPSANLSVTNPTFTYQVMNTDLQSERMVTNRLNYGTANVYSLEYNSYTHVWRMKLWTYEDDDGSF